MIAYLDDEDGDDDVEAALIDPTNRCHVHSVNPCELYYRERDDAEVGEGRAPGCRG